MPGKPRGSSRPRGSPRPLTAKEMADPLRLFNQSELAQILHVTRALVRAAQKGGAPFFGGYSRPEWISDWMKEHPTNEKRAETG